MWPNRVCTSQAILSISQSTNQDDRWNSAHSAERRRQPSFGKGLHLLCLCVCCLCLLFMTGTGEGRRKNKGRKRKVWWRHYQEEQRQRWDRYRDRARVQGDPSPSSPASFCSDVCTEYSERSAPELVFNTSTVQIEELPPELDDALPTLPAWVPGAGGATGSGSGSGASQAVFAIMDSLEVQATAAAAGQHCDC
jgi:hypothetical protein